MGDPRGPLHLTGEVLATRRVGALRVLTLKAPGMAPRARPGNVLAVSLDAAHLARRTLWIRRMQPSGPFGGTVDVVVWPGGHGARWLGDRRVGEPLTITGPLGTPFALPRQPVRCLVAGDGSGTAVALALAERLRERGCEVELVLAAPTESHLLPTVEARRVARKVSVLTADGSAGEPGTLQQRAAELLARSSAEVVYAAGPVPAVRPLAEACTSLGIRSQVAVEHPMPCATGLCHGCPMPVRGEDGVARQVRACVAGPVLRGDRVRWEDT